MTQTRTQRSEMGEAVEIELPVYGVNGDVHPSDECRIRDAVTWVEGAQPLAIDAVIGRVRIRYSGGSATLRKVFGALASSGFHVPKVSIELTVSGMRCHECERRIQDVLGQLSGVLAVSATAETGLVLLTYVNPTTLDAAGQTLDKIGFSIRD